MINTETRNKYEGWSFKKEWIRQPTTERGSNKKNRVWNIYYKGKLITSTQKRVDIPKKIATIGAMPRNF